MRQNALVVRFYGVREGGLNRLRGRRAWLVTRYMAGGRISGAGLWYGCDALALGRICVTDLSADRKAVRIAQGYLGFIMKDTWAGARAGMRDRPRGRFAAERGGSGRDPRTRGRLH